MRHLVGRAVVVSLAVGAVVVAVVVGVFLEVGHEIDRAWEKPIRG